MRTFIFGANGMLGTYLHKYLKDSIPVGKHEVEAMIIQNKAFYQQLQAYNFKRGDVIINAIGIINKRIKTSLEFMTVNSLFPRLLADYCEKHEIKLIHVSTDCVFDGKLGEYTENDLSDDISVYGISKFAGEPSNCTVIRVSIIGENKNNSQDLLEWVRTHKDTVITGWVNHIWNGITCLQFAKICEWIIENGDFWMGVRHFYSPTEISKADLVEMISTIYNLNNKINKIIGPSDCNRILSSIYIKTIIIPELEVQIKEQKGFLD